jgi:hypothetical protein
MVFPISDDVVKGVVLPYLYIKEQVLFAGIDRYTYRMMQKYFMKRYKVFISQLPKIICKEIDCGDIDRMSKRYNYCIAHLPICDCCNQVNRRANIVFFPPNRTYFVCNIDRKIDKIWKGKNDNRTEIMRGGWRGSEGSNLDCCCTCIRCGFTAKFADTNEWCKIQSDYYSRAAYVYMLCCECKNYNF